MKDRKYSLEYIAMRISKGECLVCGVDLDKEFGDRKWHIPLCTEHRKKLLEEMK